MIKVTSYLCLGCGLCAQSCPQGAIYIISGRAQIVQSKCNSCGLCIGICPQGAIIESVTIPSQNLSEEIQVMRKQVEAILAKIDSIGSTSPANK